MATKIFPESFDFIEFALEPRVEAGRVVSRERRLQRPDRLQIRLLEGAADGHRLADGLHLGAEAPVGARELLEGEARNFHDHVVERGLEAGRSHLGYVVLELVERVADGEERGDLGDREASRLRRERGRARDARVHLDDDAPAGLRVDRPLHVGAAGLDADLLEDADGVVAHRLVFAVGQRLDRRDGDRVAGVDAHRVHVLDGADDHGVAGLVAHHLHFEFLPADERLLDQYLVVERCLQAARDDLAEFALVVRDAAAGAAEGEAGADDERPRADIRRDPLRLLRRMGAPRLRHVESELRHGGLEEVAVLGARDGLGVRADHLYSAFCEDAGLRQPRRHVERGLSAKRREQRVRALLADDRGDGVDGQRLDVGRLGHLRVGHHRRRIGVREDDFVSLFAQRLHRLAAGVVEFAALADYNRTGADDQYLFQVGSLHT